MRTFILIAIMTTVFAAAVSGPAYAGDRYVRIGVLYNLTGDKAQVDSPGFRGMELARDVINSNGGVLGKKLLLVAADCKSEPDKVELAAETLAAQEGITILAGLNDSEDAMVAVPSATSRDKLFVTAGSTLQNLPYMFGKYCYMAAFGDNMQARAASKYAARRLETSKAWIATDISNEYTKNLGKYYKRSFRKYGGRVLNDVWYTRGNATFPMPPSDVSGDKDSEEKVESPDVLFLASTSGSAPGNVTALRKAGFEQPVMGGDSFDTKLMESMEDKYATQIFITTHVAYDNPSPVVQNFVNLYRKKYGDDPENGYAALGYDTVMLIAEAVERAQSIDPEEVRMAFAETEDFEGVTGKISYPEGMRVPFKTVDIVRFEHGTFSFMEQILPN